MSDAKTKTETQQEAKTVVEDTKKQAIKTLEEDDEFEDFPEDDWAEAQTLGSNQQDHLWDESWEDHDDDNDDFTKRLIDELKKGSN